MDQERRLGHARMDSPGHHVGNLVLCGNSALNTMRCRRLRASNKVVFLAMNIEEPVDSVIQSSVLASIAGIHVPTILHSESSVSYSIAIGNHFVLISMLAEWHLGITYPI